MKKNLLLAVCMAGVMVPLLDKQRREMVSV